MDDDSTQRNDDPPNPASPDGILRIFHYVTEPKAWFYRPLMKLFSDAKARFVLHLRPAELLTLLEKSGIFGGTETGDRSDIAELEPVLTQLCKWGNLQSHFDTADVATVEAFNKPRFLYQITKRGEAAERALRTFEESVEQPGELQATALNDIRDYLGQLEQLAGESGSDAGKILQTLVALTGRFDQLTSRAQTFIASLQPSVQLQTSGMESFFAYKQMLIDYLQRFVQDLVTRTVEIVASIERIDAGAGGGCDRILMLAGERELADAVEKTDAKIFAATERWRQRWQGLRGWFIGDGERRSQAEELRAHVRAAIPALLRAVSTIHDRRVQRSDRAADLKTLARWFVACEDDGEAARLWRAAFALSSARHLRVTEETLDKWDQDEVRPSASWLDAPPMHISPRLRQTGKIARRGRPSGVLDRSAEKAKLKALADLQAQQAERAREELITGGVVLLSSVGKLSVHAFDLFLELLGEALAQKSSEFAAAEATSIDGAIVIYLVPAPEKGTAVIETPWGRFRGCDHFIHIRNARGAAKTPARGTNREQAPAPDDVAVGAEA